MSTKAPDTSLLLPRMTLLANLLRRSAAARYRREFDLAQVEWGILSILGSTSPLTLGELAHEAGLDKAQVSRAVTNLAALKLVNRATGRDPREVSLSLTRPGQALYARLRGATQQRAASLMQDFSADERDALEAMLPQLIARARALLADEHANADEPRG